MNFKDILETLPSIEHLTGLDVLKGESVIHHIMHWLKNLTEN